MSSLTAIALSGGVDSLVSAFLLKEAGHNIVGLHFLNGFEPYYIPPGSAPDWQKPYCIENPASAGYGKLHSSLRGMVAGLQIPVLIFDCAAPFRKLVIDYFQGTYQSGETPNPCMVCNRRIKFGIMLDAARELGAKHLATGHYVRTCKTPDGLIHLHKGQDAKKDQAYFLARLTQDQLAGTCFPLGEMQKKKVIQLAGQQGLRPLAKRESQDVCFIGNQTYGSFLVDTLNFKPSPGHIEDLHGNRIGRHQGLHLFTIGQRRGINCPSSAPYYVCGLDMTRNVLKVGSKDDLLSKNCLVNDINWIIPPSETQMRLQTRTRYRSQAADATVTVSGDTTSARVQFDTPQSALTPGQGAVFYRSEEILGGGWISTAG
ncbi:MAG: tRNA 2-thiouridine(34) synthase MnmA [Desulfobacterales bacterium]|nr:tRNA 2-thiouridine(34) synthase MnmA [Desulfobacterales bacterium]